jgi:hypothetical protein
MEVMTVHFENRILYYLNELCGQYIDTYGIQAGGT